MEFQKRKMGSDTMSWHWKEQEIQYLKENYKKYTDEELGQYLHRTSEAVRLKRLEYDLYRKWTPEEIEFLELNYKTLSDEEIGEHLGRSKDGVKGKRFRMGFCNSIERNMFLDIVHRQEKAGFIKGDAGV
jgi:hypothetical protein